MDITILSYDALFAETSPPASTYIFTDFERLPPWRLFEAAILFRDLKKRGLKVLNNPAAAKSRYGTLRKLFRSGINQFNAYRVEEMVTPRRWPVFLRMEGDHAKPVSGLVTDSDQLRKAVAAAVARGFPISAMLVVEYAGEPVRPGLFRKLSMFRVGPQLLGYTSAHDTQWLVKYGKPAIAPLELYDEEYRFVAEHSFRDAIAPAFDQAGIDYGRVDFGLVDGKPQIFEINTNPQLFLSPAQSTVERRNESVALFRENFIAALAAIDSQAEGESGVGRAAVEA
jgi:hypothetical protein